MKLQLWVKLTSLFLWNIKFPFHQIVGSSRGLGRELALKLGKQNATVICIDVQTPEQEETSKRVMDASRGSAYYYQCDVTDKDQVDKTIDDVAKNIGDITMLFHCCSLPSPRAVVNNPPSVKQTIDVSVTSYFYVSFPLILGLSSPTASHFLN